MISIILWPATLINLSFMRNPICLHTAVILVKERHHHESFHIMSFRVEQIRSLKLLRLLVSHLSAFFISDKQPLPSALTVMTQVRIDGDGGAYATWQLSRMPGLLHHNGLLCERLSLSYVPVRKQRLGKWKRSSYIRVMILSVSVSVIFPMYFRSNAVMGYLEEHQPHKVTSSPVARMRQHASFVLPSYISSFSPGANKDFLWQSRAVSLSNLSYTVGSWCLQEWLAP